MLTPTALDTKLERRGILPAARSNRWQPAQRGNGWEYPVFDQEGREIARRFKHQDSSANPKYLWLNDTKAEYYHAPDVTSAIAAARGVLIIANGEPGVLTFHAAGIRNVLCVFGEHRLPDNAGMQIKAWGVTHVEYYPDLDPAHNPAGLKAARKWHDLLEAVGITFNAYDLKSSGYNLPEKGDTNDLWQAVGFDRAAFMAALKACPLAVLPESQDKPRLDTIYLPSDSERYTADFKRVMGIAAEGARKFRRWKGDETLICSPFREDKKPSFSYNREKCTGYDHATGQGYSAEEIAAAWGIDPRDYRPARQPRAARRKSTRGAAVQKAVTEPQPVTLPTFTADRQVDVRYITQLDANDFIGHRALLIKSPTNTGKTAFIGRYYAVLKLIKGYEPRVLVITHRQALAENLSRRLTDETGIGFNTYKGLKAAEVRQVPRLVICYNSLWKLAPTIGQELPKYDLIVVDELQQFHGHIEGDTMRGGDALKAYTYLRQLVSTTPRFIGLDAHLSNVSREWVKAVAGRVYCLENTYVFDRGVLKLHSDSSTVIDAAKQCAMNSSLPIAIPCTSAGQAKAVYELFAGVYGVDRVRVVHGENSEDKDTQQFISAINAQLPALKVLIYTTSLGTGVDITAPVAGVFCLFNRVDGLSAYDQIQLMARCRNAAALHVFVEPCEGHRETDPERIYKKHERNAYKTGQFCDFDQHGIVTLPDVLRSAGKLLSMLGAEKNAALNNPLAYFVALATGYKITYQDGKNSAVNAEMKAARESVHDREKTAILAAEVVTHEELQAARDAGKLTPEKRYGHEAFKILDAVGRDELTDQLYTDLHTSEKRGKLRRFTNLDESPDVLKELDRAEGRAGVLFSKRAYHTVNQSLAINAFTAVWGENWRAGIDQELTAADIESRLASFLDSDARHDLYSFMGRRYGGSQKAIPLLRWMLEQHGLALRSRQVMRDGARFMVYQLDAAALAKMDDYAATRRLHLARKRAEAEAQRITKNPYIEPSIAQNSAQHTAAPSIPPRPAYRTSTRIPNGVQHAAPI